MEDSFKTVDIAKIGIDDLGRLVVYPKLPFGQDFAFVYRAGMEVSWDAKSKCLFVPVPREWSQTQWFTQIFRAVEAEYEVRLSESGDTKWENILPDDRAGIENFLRIDGAARPAR